MIQLNFKELGIENSHNGCLIVMHGLFGMLDNWMTVGKRMAEKYQVFLLDLRNHGRSEWSDGFSYTDMSLDLYEFIRNQAIDTPIYVIGHSMGGKVAMQFAADYPEMLQKLVVVDIAPRAYPVHHGTILEALNDIDLHSLTNRNEAEEVMKKYGLDIGTRQFLMKNLYRTEDNKFAWRMNLEVLTAEIGKIGEELHYQKPLLLPTLFIAGGRSSYIQADDSPLITHIFPHSEIAIIKDSGHWVHAEKPEELLDRVMKFLAN
ncbi:MAG: alpha/beta fold hydrolase [Thermoflexibacter sp.]|jgi:pimeloyl-ACP methyl ester carboxylesterase|nr:alpha/beta fold hydrolase [Thermoflexibacter sp.]